jgi:hypothetical protein
MGDLDLPFSEEPVFLFDPERIRLSREAGREALLRLAMGDEPERKGIRERAFYVITLQDGIP